MARHVAEPERASQNSNFFEVVVGVDLRCRAHNCCEFCWCRHKFFNRDLNFVFLHCPYARSRALSPWSNFQIKFRWSRWAGWDLARSRVFSQVSSQWFSWFYAYDFIKVNSKQTRAARLLPREASRGTGSRSIGSDAARAARVWSTDLARVWSNATFG